MGSRPLLKLTLLGGAGAGAYYLYNGGNPKVAEKQFEHDAATLSRKVKGELPGAEREAKTGAKLSAEEAGQKVNQSIDALKDQSNRLSNKISAYTADAEKKLDQARKDAGSELTKAVDKFDSSVEKGASQAKSGISSWFGGSK